MPVEVVADQFRQLVPKHDQLLQARPAQVEKAILEAQLFVGGIGRARLERDERLA